MKYIEFLTNNNAKQSDQCDSSSIFDLQVGTSSALNHQSDFVQNILGIDTELTNLQILNHHQGRRETLGDVKELDDEESSSKIIDLEKRGGRFRRQLSNMKEKVLAFNFKRNEENNKERSSSSSEIERKGGLRMGTLLVRSIMSTYISENQRKKNELEALKSANNSIKTGSTQSSSSSSESESLQFDAQDDLSTTSKKNIVIMDTENLCQIMRKFLEQDKIKEDDNWMIPEIQHDETEMNIDVIKNYLNDGDDDDDGYEIWIKPDVTLNDVDDRDDNQVINESIFHSFKEQIRKKFNSVKPSASTSSLTNIDVIPTVVLNYEDDETENESNMIIRRSKPAIHRQLSHRRIGSRKTGTIRRGSLKTNRKALSRKINFQNKQHHQQQHQKRKTINAIIQPSFELLNNINQTNQKHEQNLNFFNRNEMLMLDSTGGLKTPDSLGTSSTSTSSTALTVIAVGSSLPPIAQSPVPVIKGTGHHIRAESNGGGVVYRSPIKSMNPNIGTTMIIPPTTTNSNKEIPGTSGTGIFRRSSDSDLSVTPKGECSNY